MEDITQAVARMTDDDDMKGGRMAARKKAGSKKTAVKSKSKSASKHKAKKSVSKNKIKSPVMKKQSKSTGSKRKLTDYMKFLQKEMPLYRAKHPNPAKGEAFKAIAAKWNKNKK